MSHEGWSEDRFERDVLRPLDDKFGADVVETKRPEGFESRRIRMDNGDNALFAWNGTGYWLGNTETPEALWRTEKRCFEDVGGGLARWAQMEMYDVLEREAPWTSDYPLLSWFFLPVLMAKDGRRTTREFFRGGAGFPEASGDEAMSYYEDVVSTGVFDGCRYEMASKLGTGDGEDAVRMAATMGEFNAAAVLADAGYELEAEPAVAGGRRMDYVANGPGAPEGVLVEVTRPSPPRLRGASTAEGAVRESAVRKRRKGQIADADGVLMVDCSSMTQDQWERVVDDRPESGHEPTLFYRVFPGDGVEAYLEGATRLRLSDAVDWV